MIATVVYLYSCWDAKEVVVQEKYGLHPQYEISYFLVSNLTASFLIWTHFSSSEVVSSILLFCVL